jgi:hypothetical protein
MDSERNPGVSCCGAADACVFAKALRMRSASCELVRREALGDGDTLVCSSAVAHANCATLAALMRERASFALRLPRDPAPLMHAKALQLHCGGLAGVQQALQTDTPDVHRMVGQAQQRWGSLMDLPWNDIVRAIAAWAPRRGPR